VAPRLSVPAAFSRRLHRRDPVSRPGLHLRGAVPAVLLLPFVAIWGLSTNQTALAIGLAAVGIAAAWLVARRIGVSAGWAWLLAAFLLFGTSYAYCSANGDVWFVAQSGSVAFTMLAIAECLGDRVPWRVLLWALCAAFCRYPMILALPAYAIAVWPQIRAKPVRLVDVATIGALFAVPAAYYNYVRWGTIADVGFPKFYRIMDIGRTDPSPPFALRNLAMQLHFYFQQPPEVLGHPPYLIAGEFGTALTFTSPALAIALLAPIRERAVQLLWLATACCAEPALLYYSTGWCSSAARHALDFHPVSLRAHGVRDPCATVPSGICRCSSGRSASARTSWACGSGACLRVSLTGA